jgi:hypothetical protein
MRLAILDLSRYTDDYWFSWGHLTSPFLGEADRVSADRVSASTRESELDWSSSAALIHISEYKGMPSLSVTLESSP